MTTLSYLITAPQAAELVRDALASGRSELAVRRLTEAVARVIENAGREIPDSVFAEPETTGGRKCDTGLATAFLYAANLCQVEAPTWSQVPPLAQTLLWGGDGFESEPYKAFIRSQTPTEFLERNILTRPRDWVNA